MGAVTGIRSGRRIAAREDPRGERVEPRATEIDREALERATAPRDRIPAAAGERVVELRPDLRIFDVGKTRSGKSTWLRQATVCGSLERAIILDTKGEPPWIDFARRYGYEIRNGERAAIAALRDPEPPPRILARCFDPLGADALELCEEIFRTRFGTTVVDELAHWCRGHETNRGLRWVWTMGGGLGIGGYGATQRPTGIWLGFISESDRRIVFRLELKRDRDTLADNGVSGVDRAASLDRFWWLYQSADDFEPAAVMRPVSG